MHLPGHTSPDWSRCTLATIPLDLLNCYHSPWGRTWNGSWGWGLQGPQRTSFSLYFSPMCHLHPCLLLHLRFGAVRSGRLHNRQGIHRVRVASLHKPGHPSCAGQPCGSLHSILDTCSSGDVCACWLAHTMRCSLALSLSLSLTAAACLDQTQHAEELRRCKTHKSQERRRSLAPSQTVILLFVPPNPEKQMRR